MGIRFSFRVFTPTVSVSLSIQRGSKISVYCSQEDDKNTYMPQFFFLVGKV